MGYILDKNGYFGDPNKILESPYKIGFSKSPDDKWTDFRLIINSSISLTAEYHVGRLTSVLSTSLFSLNVAAIFNNCGIIGLSYMRERAEGYITSLDDIKSLGKKFLQAVETYITRCNYKVMMANDGSNGSTDRFLLEYGTNWNRMDYGTNYNYMKTPEHHVISWTKVIDQELRKDYIRDGDTYFNSWQFHG